ncbi:MAG: hypothetical protein K1X53_08110 [Candidatus Sumerlaeaceae bacterium]|nr:hypothetical protein [Candidatus Sumerlaeaceae bacterium]
MRLTGWFAVALLLVVSSMEVRASDEFDPTPIGQPPSAPADQFAEPTPSPNDIIHFPRPPKPAAIGIAPAARQPAGALSGRIVYMSGGHGYTADSSGVWYTQRGNGQSMVEDFGNLDQMTMYAMYCFNAGATVVPFRPVGYQSLEIILDNDDPGVTFLGTWTNSAATVYYGSPGDVPYRFASKSPIETATARYTPTIATAGFYPVYCWTRDGSDRVPDQLYRIASSGGLSEVRINHRRVGKGWIYLGTYFFQPGTSGYVEISNETSSGLGTYVFADAIRFGNGMGTINRGAGVSGKPREDEASRYWVQNGIGQGASSSIYDGSSTDQDDNVGTPPRMASYMNNEAEGTFVERIFLSFHSNAGGGRGCDGLYNNTSLFPGTATPHQFRWATLQGRQTNDDMVAIGAPPLENAWTVRGATDSAVTFARTDYAFGEIRNDSINGEMDATISEVAFHDSSLDAPLLRDPKVRNWIARAAYKATVKYFNEFATGTLALLPEPPINVRATANNGVVTVGWDPPGSVVAGGDAPTGYVVYKSFDGYGFGNPVVVPGGAATSTAISGLPTMTPVYFRVAATNAGGESLPSETVGVKFAASGRPKVLVVNGFDRLARTLNPIESGPHMGGPTGATGSYERVKPRKSNSADYIVQHAIALSSVPGATYDCCANECITNGQVTMDQSVYKAVDWILGEESTTDKTFSAAEQTAVTNYFTAGGNLFLSGSEIAYDLDSQNNGRTFYRTKFYSQFSADTATTYSVAASPGGIFTPGLTFDFNPANGAPYDANSPDVLTALAPGLACLAYGTGTIAGVQANSGSYKVVNFGFPFETITDASKRATVMTQVMIYFGVPASGVDHWELY